MKITLDDHSAEVLSALDAAIARFVALKNAGLWQRGMQKSYAPWTLAICATASRTR